jgi:hypothetical protein
MLTQAEVESTLLSTLQSYYYDNVLNYVTGQLRNNVKMVQLNTYPIAGVFSSSSRQVSMPASIQTFFNLFAVNIKDLSSVFRTTAEENIDTWITLEDLCNNYNINIDIYCTNGLMIPKRLVYFTSKQDAANYLGYFAIDTRAVNNATITTEDMYLTMYVDPTIEANKEVTSYIPVLDSSSYTLTLNVLINTFNANKANASLYINGYYYNNPSASILQPAYLKDKEVELCIDEDIDIQFTIDTRAKYNSTTDNQFKDIIHVPKQYNDNIIRTINLAHIFVYSTNTGKGIKLPFTVTSTTYQLTYCDLAIPSEIIDYAINFLADENIQILVRFNKYNDQLTVKYNQSWLPVIYNDCTDDEIISIYKGDVSSLVGKLDGNTLEQSYFNKLVYGSLSVTGSTALSNLINGIGYYNIPGILGENAVSVSISNDTTLTSLSVDRHPLIEIGEDTFMADVYVDGVKIGYDVCSYVATSTKCTINISDSYYQVTPSSRIDVILHVGNQSGMIRFTPTTGKLSCSVTGEYIKDLDSINMYKVTTLSTGDALDLNKQSYQYAYVLLSDADKAKYVGVSYASLVTTFTFNANAIGNAYVIVPKYYTNYYTQAITLNSNTSKIDSIRIQPRIESQVEAVSMPFLGATDVDVFLNGKHLTANLDYRVVDYTSPGIVDKYINIQNYDYLKTNGTNVVDILMKSYTSLDSITGFVVDKKFAGGDGTNNLWLTGNTAVYINGLYIRNSSINYTYEDEFTITDTAVDAINTTAYSVNTTISNLLNTTLTKYADTSITNVVSAVLNYLVSKSTYIAPSQEIISRYRSIYSTYLNTVIYQTLLDSSAGNVYSYTQTEIAGYLSNFDVYKDHDVIFIPNFLKDQPIKRIYNNMNPNYIEIKPAINFDLNASNSEVSITKLIFIRAIVDYVLNNY